MHSTIHVTSKLLLNHLISWFPSQPSSWLYLKSTHDVGVNCTLLENIFNIAMNMSTISRRIHVVVPTSQFYTCNKFSMDHNSIWQPKKPKPMSMVALA